MPSFLDFLGSANAEYSHLIGQFPPRKEMTDLLARDVAGGTETGTSQFRCSLARLCPALEFSYVCAECAPSLLD